MLKRQGWEFMEIHIIQDIQYSTEDALSCYD